MFEQFYDFSKENWMGALIGIAVWTLFTWVRPDWGKRLNSFSGKRWWIMALISLALFGGETVMVWLEGSHILATAIGLFTLVIVAMWIRRGWLGDMPTGVTSMRSET
ncbi:MAG: hypothetical protein KDA52_12115 [Planctomycetaceae bacterium]|nr:hypothetical protein [Planctomycetaceae bacterium]